MGASPDGLVNCLCCGSGICEVIVHWTVFFNNMIIDINFLWWCHIVSTLSSKSYNGWKCWWCWFLLGKIELSWWKLSFKKNHSYYYQVYLLIHVIFLQSIIYSQTLLYFYNLDRFSASYFVPNENIVISLFGQIRTFSLKEYIQMKPLWQHVQRKQKLSFRSPFCQNC